MFKNVEDVIEVAVRVERKGIDFYKNLYEKMKLPKAKDVFSFLAAEEEKHAGMFRELLGKVADYEPHYDYPGEYGVFINSVAAGLIEKAQESIDAAHSVGVQEAIDAGIALEKETILFYSELLDKFDLPDKEILKDIIKEEKLHWQKLESLKNTLLSE